jgi:hypothetical protein
MQQSTPSVALFDIPGLDLKGLSCCLVTPASRVMLHSVGARSRAKGYFLACPQLVDSSSSGKAVLLRSKPVLLVRASGVSFPARMSGTSTGRQTVRRRLLLKEGGVTNITRKKLALTVLVVSVEDRYLVRGARRRYFECNANARIEIRP